MNSVCKLNPSTEIIPIYGAGNKKRNGVNRVKPQVKPTFKHQKQPKAAYFSDSYIIPRVKQYLEEHKDSYPDIDDIVADLQKKYREYGRRKRSDFKGLVKRAYTLAVSTLREDDDDMERSSESQDDEIDSEDLDSLEQDEANKQLMALYMTEKHRKDIGQGGVKELINISSDDEVEELDEAANQNRHQKSPVIPATMIANELSQGSPCPSNQCAPPNTVRAFMPPLIPARIQVNQIRKRKASERVLGNFPPKRGHLPVPAPKTTFKDFGGHTKMLEDVCRLLVHIRHPEVYRQIGVSPPRGFLLHGPPGCGKSLLAQAIAGELRVPLMKVAAPELVAGVSGQSEERIRDLFSQALALAPCVLFLDEVDAIAPNRVTAQREMERRIVAQLLSCLDELGIKENGDRVLVIGATNRPDAIDPALRRAGRFDREVCLGIPDQQARLEILKVLCKKLRLTQDFDYEQVAKLTPGFVGADLMALTTEAAIAAVNRVFTDLKKEKSDEKKKSMVIKAKECLVDNEQKSRHMDVSPVVSPKSKKRNLSTEDKGPDDIDGPKKPEAASSEVAPDDDSMQEEPSSSTQIKKKKTQKNLVGDTCEAVEVREEVVTAKEKDKVTQLICEEVQNYKKAHIKTEFKKCDAENVSSTLEELISWLHDQPPLSSEQLEDLRIEMSDFNQAMKRVQPSAKREGFATVPDVTWDDIGSLQDIREELQMAILAPVRHPEQFAALGLTTATGVLLCGPPGCGKTLLAKAIANEAGINFISVKGPELLNMYVGESERAVRQCFQRARNSVPCVIFFDELDALCPKRSDSREGTSSMRVVNQMLTEMDGIEGRQGVFLMAASNRPDIVDPAVLRPGRLDKVLYVGLPTAEGRGDILRALTRGTTLNPHVDVQQIGAKCHGYTGADLAALVREAGVEALRQYMLAPGVLPLQLTTTHFEKALSKIRPSVHEKDIKHYEKLRQMYSAVPSVMDSESSASSMKGPDDNPKENTCS